MSNFMPASNEKNSVPHNVQLAEDAFIGDPVDADKAGTIDDQRDMERVGKKQHFRRNFRFLSILGFILSLTSVWEAVLLVCNYGLINGGIAGMFWTQLAVGLGFVMVILSLAEMSSMAPTSSGQPHWVSEFAPRQYQRFLSYIIGWLCVMGWQTGAAINSYLVTALVQGLIILHNPEYIPEGWHGTLMIIATAFMGIFINTFLVKKLPLIEMTAFIVHIVGFFIVVIPMWVMAPHNSAAKVFTKFEDNGNWGNMGLACLVGMTGAIFGLIGPDSAVHMAEEIKDASRIVPLAMIYAAIFNSILGLLMVVTIGFTIGDIPSVLATKTDSPMIQIFFDSTKSYWATAVMTSIVIFMMFSSLINSIASSSRQMFAFARDKGLPMSSWLSYVRPAPGKSD
ncbi:MAG: hypothetical protein M1834_005889 [Cirrosporium novae-zelandiae]|nr:MAG: hypothetical protein M1834_005889 [Cirrosporium novae-zelandiae]